MGKQVDGTEATALAGDFFCHLLLFFATTTEREQLREAATSFDLPFERLPMIRPGSW